MNTVFFAIVYAAFLFAILNGTPEQVGQGALDAAKASVSLAIGLIGYIALFLGLMKVVEEAGGLRFMARVIRPVLVKLFPDVPADHPAMGAMVMNVAANALGLGNAATPFGLKAMKELSDLSEEQGTATNAMVLFLAINTSGLALLPTGIIALRALEGSASPAAIFSTTLVATGCSTMVGVFAAKSLSKLPVFAAPKAQRQADAAVAQATARIEPHEWFPVLAFAAGMVALVGAAMVWGESFTVWIIPTLIVGMLSAGWFRGVAVYEVFVEGAKDGWAMAKLIVPYLVAILSAVSMLRASGGLDLIIHRVRPVTDFLGMPPEVLPLALLRPLSGSGGYGLTADLIKTHGPDTVVGQIASTMQGSTETTFYVLAVYFGSIGVYRTRHAVPAGLAADVTGAVVACWAVYLLL